MIICENTHARARYTRSTSTKISSLAIKPLNHLWNRINSETRNVVSASRSLRNVNCERKVYRIEPKSQSDAQNCNNDFEEILNIFLLHLEKYAVKIKSRGENIRENIGKISLTPKSFFLVGVFVLLRCRWRWSLHSLIIYVSFGEHCGHIHSRLLEL